MEDEKGRYMVEVLGLSPDARWEDVYQFFVNCGNIINLEINRYLIYLINWYVDYSEIHLFKQITVAYIITKNLMS